MTLDPRCPSGCGCRVRNQGEWCIHCWPYTEEAARTGLRLDPIQPEPMPSSPQFTLEQEIVLAACRLVNRDRSEHAAALERIAKLVAVLQSQTNRPQGLLTKDTE